MVCEQRGGREMGREGGSVLPNAQKMLKIRHTLTLTHSHTHSLAHTDRANVREVRSGKMKQSQFSE